MKKNHEAAHKINFSNSLFDKSFSLSLAKTRASKDTETKDTFT